MIWRQSCDAEEDNAILDTNCECIAIGVLCMAVHKSTICTERH